MGGADLVREPTGYRDALRRAVRRWPDIIEAASSASAELRSDFEQRAGVRRRTLVWADYGLVYVKTGAHPPGEPAVPGGERADAGVPAVAALPPGHAVVLDRELERGQIDRVLDLARQGRSAALVLQGEPGIGKTTLLDYAVESGRDFETVRVLGIESEAELGFAALHQLVLPFAAGLGSLPVPQRDALAA